MSDIDWGDVFGPKATRVNLHKDDLLDFPWEPKKDPLYPIVLAALDDPRRPRGTSFAETYSMGPALIDFLTRRIWPNGRPTRAMLDAGDVSRHEFFWQDHRHAYVQSLVNKRLEAEAEGSESKRRPTDAALAVLTESPGLDLQAIATGIGMSLKATRERVRQLYEDGRIDVVEVATGAGGSARKTYYVAGGAPTSEDGPDDER